MNAHLYCALRRVHKTVRNLKVHNRFSGLKQVQSKTTSPKEYFQTFGIVEGHSKGQN